MISMPDTKTASRPRPRLGWARLAPTAVLAIAALIVFADQLVFAEKIFPGVQIGSVNVGWLTRDQASATLARRLSGSREMTLVWPDGKKRVRIKGDDFGIDPDAAAAAAYEAGRSGDVILRLGTRFTAATSDYAVGTQPKPRGTVGRIIDDARALQHEPAVDARFVIEKGQVQVEPGKTGEDVDERGSALELADAFLSRRFAVRLPVTVVEPKTTTAMAARLLPKARAWAVQRARVTVNGGVVTLSSAKLMDMTTVSRGKLAIDPQHLEKALAVRSASIAQPSQDAYFTVVDSRVRIRGGQVGRSVDATGTAVRLTEGLNAAKASVAAVVHTTQPSVTRGDLAALHIGKLLSSFTTEFRLGEDNRDVNIALSAEAIRGKVLNPGEVFSLNRETGPRNRATGYREALTFQGGKVVPGIGGGVCQVSSTLYDAALLANLRIIKRSNHSMAVSYVPPGYDATTFYPTVDLKFQNNRESAILLWSAVRRNRLTIQVFGSGYSPKVRIQTKVRQAGAPKTTIIYTSKLPRGVRRVEVAGRPGYIAYSWRVVLRGKTVLRRELLAKDVYRARSSIVEVGN